MWRLMSSMYRGVLDRRRREQEMSEELAAHIEMRAADLVAGGLSPSAAARRARVEFGSIEAHKDECRQALVWHIADDLVADLRYGYRILRRSPGFVVVAVLSLALGIGVNAIVFSVLNGALLRPLPVPDPERIRFLETTRGANAHSYPNYRDLRDNTTAFAGLAAYRLAAMQVEFPDGPQRAWGYLASGNYFDVLGAQPALGRFLHPADDGAPGTSPYAVLSYDIWHSRFGADPAVIGREIRINRIAFTIVGVAPPELFGTEVFYRPALWVSMAMQPQIEIGNPWLDSRETSNTLIAGRLAPGVTVAQAEADLNRVAATLTRDFPRENRDLSFRLTEPGWLGSEVRAPMRAFMVGVLVLASLVLCVACANLASQLLARGDGRRRELAIRAAIGAGRARLFRQLTTEAVMLAAAGGLVGWAATIVAAEVLSRVRLPLGLPMTLDVRVDAHVLAFAVVMSGVAILLFGVAPARRASSADPNEVLKETSATTTRRWRLRHLIVVAQVALSFAVVTASLLSLQGLRRMIEQPIGFDPDHLYTALLDLGPSGYDRVSGTTFRARLLEDIRQRPGVTHAAYISAVPLSSDQSTTRVLSEAEAQDSTSRGHEASYRRASPKYFETAGTRIVAGRDFDDGDTRERPRVAIVNETFARRVLQVNPADAVGRRFLYPGRTVPISVVGVVADGKYRTPTEAATPAVFESLLQLYAPEARLIVRSSLPEGQVLAAIRTAVAALDPQIPLGELGPARDQLAMVLLPSRAAAIALNVFGLLTVVLAGTGLQGLLALMVAKQRRDLAIRAALGAAPFDLLRTVSMPLVWFLTIGCAAGALLSLAAQRLVAAIVLNAPSLDGSLAGAAVVIVAIGGLASVTPAWRAVRADPALTLRCE